MLKSAFLRVSLEILTLCVWYEHKIGERTLARAEWEVQREEMRNYYVWCPERKLSKVVESGTRSTCVSNADFHSLMLPLLLNVCAWFCLFVCAALLCSSGHSHPPLSPLFHSIQRIPLWIINNIFRRYKQALILWLPIQFHAHKYLCQEWSSLVSRYCPTNKTHIRRLFATFFPHFVAGFFVRLSFSMLSLLLKKLTWIFMR